MKRLTTAMCCAMVSSAAVAAAQSEAMDKDKMGKGMKGETVMMTGCVTEGTGGHYMLTNAMREDDMKGGMKGEKGEMKDHMKPMSYDLMGGDLKAHVGHKVEVTGMMASDKMMKDGKMDKDEMHKMSSDKHGAINVKSVKMISPTCS